MDPISLIIFIITILIVITVHEFAHALVADRLGDPTPRLAGRLTLNPISHIDPIGFLMLLVIRFGWAKPVPINPYNFRDPVKGEMLVSVAGPLSNLLLAWIMGSLIRFIPYNFVLIPIVSSTISNFIFLNLALGIFNLIPIPPLDGSHLLEPFIPYETQKILDQYGFFILIFLLIFPPTSYLLMDIISFFFKLVT